MGGGKGVDDETREAMGGSGEDVEVYERWLYGSKEGPWNDIRGLCQLPAIIGFSNALSHYVLLAYFIAVFSPYPSYAYQEVPDKSRGDPKEV